MKVWELLIIGAVGTIGLILLCVWLGAMIVRAVL